MQPGQYPGQGGVGNIDHVQATNQIGDIGNIADDGGWMSIAGSFHKSVGVRHFSVVMTVTSY